MPFRLLFTVELKNSLEQFIMQPNTSSEQKLQLPSLSMALASLVASYGCNTATTLSLMSSRFSLPFMRCLPLLSCPIEREVSVETRHLREIYISAQGGSSEVNVG